MRVVRSALLLLLVAAFTSAECPNGCSGHGDCMAKDMCNCHKNYQGNDCSERTCQFHYAHVDTPRGDINMDQNRKTTGWILTNSQQHPAGTYEYFNPDAVASEAHFYMECANKGICDRATGECNCFDGYEGSGCQRSMCSNQCSGHGTCESIRELGAKAGGTLVGNALPRGPRAYDLWDGNSTYGCHCDPWFHGPDCNLRHCKVGVDPMYLSAGFPRYETFVIHAYATGTAGDLSTTSWMRLRVFDYHGESFLTKKISILEDSVAADAIKNAEAIQSALKEIPNDTFEDVKCEQMGLANTDLVNYKSVRATGTLGLSVTCQYTHNPGRHRLPEAAESFFAGGTGTTVVVVPTSQQGEDVDWFTVKTTATWASAAAGPPQVITLATGSALPSTFAPVTTNRLLKLGPHIVLATTSSDTAPGTITLAFPLNHALSDAQKVIFAIDSNALPTITQAGELNAAVAVGSKTMEFTAAVTGFAVGDLVFYENQFFYARRIYENGGQFFAEFDKPFGGNSADGTAGAANTFVYKVVFNSDKSKSYEYVSECSGRGLCNEGTGLCECFRGYTNDNCNSQNILAL